MCLDVAFLAFYLVYMIKYWSRIFQSYEVLFRQNVLLSLSGLSLQHLILFETLVNKYSRLNVAIISFLVANM